jgi:hypothetical protein
MTMRVPQISFVRWGAREEKQVAGGATVELAQFGDFKLPGGPQLVTISLYAVTDAPVAGIAVDFFLQVGNGSWNQPEQITLPATDILAPVPFVLQRPASAIQTSALIRSTAGAPKTVRVSVLVGPNAPTWLTDVTCDVPIVDGGR